MDNILTNLKRSYLQGSMPLRFIFINVGVFLFTSLFYIAFLLFNQQIWAEVALGYLKLPGWIGAFACQPWSIFTYMFMHADAFHLLFNMLWLYWFGQLFLFSYSERSFGGLYILGGLCGGVLYLLFYNIFPYYETMVSHVHLVGASASVLAITVATAMREPDFSVRLFLFGSVRLKYIALFMVATDLLMITSQNAGGHIAHVGGALCGAWFTLSMQKGNDITRWITKGMDWCANLTASFCRNSGKRTKRGSSFRNKAYHAGTQRKDASKELEQILSKLRQSGYESLTTEEKRSLFDANKR